LALRQFRICKETAEENYQNYGQMTTEQAHKISCQNVHLLLRNHILGVWFFLDEPCTQTLAGREYLGTVHVTKSGKQCQAWSSSTPHVPDSALTDDKFPDGSRKAASNYCRNPDDTFTEGVWCYTMNPDTRWELCAVPSCSKSAAPPLH